jgi:hypothetical protein
LVTLVTSPLYFMTAGYIHLQMNKVPQTRLLIPTEIHCLMGLKVRSQKSRCCRALLSSQALGENPSFPIPGVVVPTILGVQSLVFLGLQRSHSDHCHFCLIAFSLWVLPAYQDIPYEYIIINYICKYSGVTAVLSVRVSTDL